MDEGFGVWDPVGSVGFRDVRNRSSVQQAACGAGEHSSCRSLGYFSSSFSREDDVSATSLSRHTPESFFQEGAIPRPWTAASCWIACLWSGPCSNKFSGTPQNDTFIVEHTGGLCAQAPAQELSSLRSAIAEARAASRIWGLKAPQSR